MTKFYGFRQNNSGGSFDIFPKKGISVEVWVEADNHEHATKRAKQVGLYFDGEGDCPCCGVRWYEHAEERETPPTEVLGWGWGWGWARLDGGPDAAEGYLHTLDGRIVPIPFKSIGV